MDMRSKKKKKKRALIVDIADVFIQVASYIYRLVGCQIADGALQVGRMTDLSRDVTVALPQDDPS